MTAIKRVSAGGHVARGPASLSWTHREHDRGFHVRNPFDRRLAVARRPGLSRRRGRRGAIRAGPDRQVGLQAPDFFLPLVGSDPLEKVHLYDYVGHHDVVMLYIFSAAS